MKIKKATACYTGGGIYVYWGQLENGDYFRACDDWDLIWICDQYTSIENEDANWAEFYDEHTIEELHDDYFVIFWNAMIDHIIKNDTNGNWCKAELEHRIIKEDKK